MRKKKKIITFIHRLLIEKQYSKNLPSFKFLYACEAISDFAEFQKTQFTTVFFENPLVTLPFFFTVSLLQYFLRIHL